MTHKSWLPIALFAAGIGLILAAVAAGMADVSLLVVFPVISGSNPLFLLGVLLIVLSFFVGFALIMMGELEAVYHAPTTPESVEKEVHGNEIPEAHRKTDFGGLVLVGPIPIAFGSNRSIAIMMLVIGVVLAIAFIIGAVFFLQ